MKAVLFDMDGVLYNSERRIAGAGETVQWLRARQIPHLFVTNTSSHGPAWLAAKLARFDIPGDADQIVTPAVAAAAWLRSKEESRRRSDLSNRERSDSDLNSDALQEKRTSKLALFMRPNARAEFAGLEWVSDDAESGADYVVVGDLGELWDFQTLTRAFRLLHSNPAAEILSLGRTRYWQAEDGLRLDVAPFTAALECAAGRTARVFGKPSAEFFDAAAQRLGIPPAEILMIGDDIEVDVGGAIQAGLRGALVKTGKFRMQDLEHSPRPDAVLDSVADLPGVWDSL